MGRVVRAQRKGCGSAFRASFDYRSSHSERSEILDVLDLPIEKEKAGNLDSFLERFKEIVLSSFKGSLTESNEKFKELTEESLQLLNTHPLLNRENAQKKIEEMQKECEMICLDTEKLRRSFLKPLKEEMEEEILTCSNLDIIFRDRLEEQNKLIKKLERSIKDIKNIQFFQDPLKRDFSYEALLEVSLSIRRFLASGNL